MGDLLRQAGQWLSGMLKQHASSKVTYSRGEAEWVLDATFGQADRDVEDQYGVRVGATMLDFLVAASDFEPVFGEPASGDRITADGRVYEVLDLAGQGHWRWSGIPGVTMRIHAKQVETEGS